MSTELNFQVISFLDRPNGSKINTPEFQPNSIKRLSDGELFTLGDRVSNGTAMCGKILSFGFLSNTVYVETDYSGVGMNLDSLVKVPTLPSLFQIGDTVTCPFKELNIPKATVIQVHFLNNKTKYDLQIWIENYSLRVYNIDEVILKGL